MLWHGYQDLIAILLIIKQKYPMIKVNNYPLLLIKLIKDIDLF